jgi:integrase
VRCRKADARVDRLIPLPEWLCRDLAALLAARAESRGSSLASHEHTSVNAHGHPVNRDTFRAKIIRPALRATSLDEQFRTYDFRHLHASMLIDDGANPLAVAQRMGHADASVTLRVYGHRFKGVQEPLTTSIDTRRQAAAEAIKPSPVVNLKTRRRRA